MAGWLEWHDESIICPNCGAIITASFCEDGNPKRKPMVITSLAGGQAQCLVCGLVIKDKDVAYGPETNAREVL